jgi:hypothetical protein
LGQEYVTFILDHFSYHPGGITNSALSLIDSVTLSKTQANEGPQYFSFFLMIFVFAMNGTCYAWISNAIPRPPAKRAAALAFVNSIGNSASIWTPFTYTDSSAPHYRPALGINIGLQVIAGICACLLRFILQRQNRQLERLENEDSELTDKELAKLRKTAEIEGIDIAAARSMQKGYRFMI